LTDAHTKLTRQEILEKWPPDFTKPDPTTLWRLLTRAAAQGLVRQEGTGRSRDPFRYWLPEREQLLRPEGDTFEALQAWNSRCVAEKCANLERTNPPKPAQEVPPSQGEDPLAPPAVASPEDQVLPPEPVPSPDPIPDTASCASPPPDPLPSPVSHAVAAEAPVRLPWPFSTMDPADVPEEVWKKARAAQQNSR
jgi:hypothetical protein